MSVTFYTCCRCDSQGTGLPVEPDGGMEGPHFCAFCEHRFCSECGRKEVRPLRTTWDDEVRDARGRPVREDE